jgi:hypothetical protein
MKAITIHQPWATLIVAGEKRYETRSWQTAHRGLLAVHAARKFTEDMRTLIGMDPFFQALARHGITKPEQLPKGAVIGVAELTDCVATPSAGAASENGPLRPFERDLPSVGTIRGIASAASSWGSASFGMTSALAQTTLLKPDTANRLRSISATNSATVSLPRQSSGRYTVAVRPHGYSRAQGTRPMRRLMRLTSLASVGMRRMAGPNNSPRACSSGAYRSSR